jgi:hypothetical protein
MSSDPQPSNNPEDPLSGGSGEGAQSAMQRMRQFREQRHDRALTSDSRRSREEPADHQAHGGN